MAVSYASDLVSLFNMFTILAIMVGGVVLGLMGYLVLRFRAKAGSAEPEDAPRLGRLPEARGHVKTAVISVTLSAIVLGVLIFGTLNVANQITSVPPECAQDPSPCLTINVTAHRFRWDFTYPNGTTYIGNLTVPTGTIVVLEIRSSDVFHSFGIQDLIQKDAIPGRTNMIWFVYEEETSDIIRCFELCGVGHERMTASFSSVSPSSFQGFCSSSGC